MQTACTPNIIPTRCAELNKIKENCLGKVTVFFSSKRKKLKEIYFFSVNTKNVKSHVLKISAISLVLRTREITDIFNTFDEIYLVFT